MKVEPRLKNVAFDLSDERGQLVSKRCLLIHSGMIALTIVGSVGWVVLRNHRTGNPPQGVLGSTVCPGVTVDQHSVSRETPPPFTIRQSPAWT